MYPFSFFQIKGKSAFSVSTNNSSKEDPIIIKGSQISLIQVSVCIFKMQF